MRATDVDQGYECCFASSTPMLKDSMTMSFEELQRKMYEYGEKIDAPKNLLKLYSAPQDGTPYVQICGDSLFYIFSERGVELDRRHTKDVDVLLYWLMDNVVFTLASQYESANRIFDQDFRRILFRKKLELMGLISKEWQNIAANSIQSILKDSPYNDRGE